MTTPSHEAEAELAAGDRHYLSAIRKRLEHLYDGSADNPRLREHLSDEVDWVDEQLGRPAPRPSDAVREARTGKHVLETAKSLGWADDGEGALEFMIRRAREVAFEDCGKTTAPLTTAAGEPVAWRWRYLKKGDAFSDWIYLSLDMLEGFKVIQRYNMDEGKVELCPLYASSHPPSDVREKVVEALSELASHKDAWRSAIERALDLSEAPSDGSDERQYWRHELKAFDRTLAALSDAGTKGSRG